MSAKDVVAFILQLLGVVTAWPVILLIIILIFRHEVRQFLPALARRLKKADIAGSSFEFTEVKALQDSIESGVEKLKDDPDKLASFVRKQVEKLLETSASSKPSAPSLPLSGRSILWVDDNPLNNAYEESIFKQLGATIKQATSTEQALHYLHQASKRYDLIISDVHRDENGRSNPTAGYELVDRVRGYQIQVPFVFYTSSAARVDRTKSKLADGVADNPSRLQDLVLDILQR